MSIGIFETIAVHHGQPIFLNAHLDRLENAMREMDIGIDYDRGDLIREIAARSAGKDGIALKLVLKDGEANFYERQNPYLTMDYQRGLDICFSDKTIDETCLLTYHKTTRRKLLDTEKKNTAAQGFGEVIFRNRQGQITEGAVSNIFCVRQGQILTPTVTSGLLDGILRRFLLSLYGTEIRETIVTEKDLFDSEEIFLTNSLMGIMPVRSLEGKRYLTGGKGSNLSKHYKALIGTWDRE